MFILTIVSGVAMEESSTKTWWILGVAIAAAALLRFLAAANNLWFDEIISVEMASQMSGPEGVFTEFLYDNNHYFNTLWVWWLGKHNSELLYRLPAVIAGVMTVPAVWWALRPWGTFSQQIAAILVAFSHVHIHYSSEARGYAMQILFAVIAFGWLERYHREERTRDALLFGAFASLSILSHLLSVNFFLGCLFWTVSFQGRRGIGFLEQLKRLTLCHALPVITGASLYLVHVRNLQFGGGPKLNTLEVAASAWSLLFGIAQPGTGRIVVGVLALGFVIAAILICRKRELSMTKGFSDQWRFFAVFLILIPLIRILVPSSLLYVRYFLLQLTFGIMLLSIAASVLIATTPEAKRLIRVAVAVIITANLVQNAQLIDYGRGDYHNVVQRISDQADGNEVTIGSTNNVLNTPVLEYFSDHPDFGDCRLQIVEPDELPQWLIVHRTMDCSARPERMLRVYEIDETRYKLDHVSRAAYLSGFEWRCYQRVDD
ncbi:MAG: glycosyltransferase family 39 protein [Planctomycetota bacterium]